GRWTAAGASWEPGSGGGSNSTSTDEWRAASAERARPLNANQRTSRTARRPSATVGIKQGEDMTKFLITLTLFFVFAVSASAQTFINKTDTKTKVYVGFINGSFDFPVTNNQGLNGSAQIKLYGYEGVRLEAVGDFSAFLRGTEKTYTYLGGP